MTIHGNPEWKAKARRLNEQGEPVGSWFDLGAPVFVDLPEGQMQFPWPDGVSDEGGQRFEIHVEYIPDPKPYGTITIE